MDEPETAPLATGPRGMVLRAFDRGGEDTAPAGYALTALWHGDLLLLVRVRERGCWELPGGRLEPGETARRAAARELWEESGEWVPPERLRFVGYATTALGQRQRVLRGAVFTAETTAPVPFVPNEEIDASCWWDGREQLPGLQTVDTCLAALTRP